MSDSPSSNSLSQQMHSRAVERLVERLKLEEVQGEGGGAWLPLISKAPMAQGEIGQVRTYRGNAIAQLVTCTIVVPAIGLDSHMLFAFTDSKGAVPHFTVDSVRTGEAYAFHLDLIPRLDLAVHLAYMDEAFGPLTDIAKAHRELPGLSPAQLDPRQYAVMSPWMLVNRADEAAFRTTFDSVDAYLEHWFKLLDGGLSDAARGGVSPDALTARDAAHRAVLFNADVDKVWNQITPLIGPDNVQKIIARLRDTTGQT